LFAGHVSSSSTDQSISSLLHGIVKKLESGENAADILRSIIPANGPQVNPNFLTEPNLYYPNLT
jgi:hypothetical protein